MPNQNPYDAFPYDALPVRATDPERLVITSWLNGGPRPATHGCRILEPGCANGANLLPLAFYNPGATLIGVDYSAGQIETAANAARDLGLNNLRFEQRDLRDGAADLGELDFIIAHGFYSWVPLPVRAAFFELCRDQLAAGGLVYVSYNVFPGWRMRGLIRDLLLRTVGEIPDPNTRGQQAQALAHTLNSLAPAHKDHPYGELLALELGLVVESGLSNVLHDHMEENNNAVSFRDFVAEIEGYGLHCLGDLPPGPREAARLDGVRKELRAQGMSGVELEQTVDLLGYRQLRTSVLCRREDAASSDPAAAIEAAFVSSELMPVAAEPDLGSDEPEVFETPQGLELQLEDRFLKTVLVALDETSPAALSVEDLGARVTELLGPSGGDDAAQTLHSQLPALYELGLVELRLSAGPRPSEPSLRAHALARHEVAERTELTSCAHTLLPLDEFDRQVVKRLDGQRDRPALVQALVETMAAGDPSIEIDGQVLTNPEELTPLVEELLTNTLRTLANWGILTAREQTP